MTTLLIIRLTIILFIIKSINIVEVLILKVIKELSIPVKGCVEIISSKLIITTISRAILIRSIFKINLIDKGSFFRN